MYVRTVKVPSSNGRINEYVRVVEAYRENGKVKQRVIADLGRRDVLVAMLPKLRRVLEGTPRVEGEEEENIDVLDTFTWGPVLVVGHLFERLGLWELLDRLLGTGREVAWADRILVLVAARLMHPCSEHGLAGWLESEYFCDRRGRRFVPRWHQRKRVRVDHTTLQEVIRDLQGRFDFERVVFVGDRGLVSESNLQWLTDGGHGYLLGIKRRRSRLAKRWLEGIEEAKWMDCPTGITAQEKHPPPGTRVQEVRSGQKAVRAFVIDSDEKPLDGASTKGVGEAAEAGGSGQAQRGGEDRRLGPAGPASPSWRALLLVGRGGRTVRLRREHAAFRG